MSRFLSTKNCFTILILWGLVLAMMYLLFLGIKKHDVSIVPIIILSFVIALILWVLLDTRYVIKKNFLLYRSGPFRGRIDINTIQKIKRHSGLFVPVTMKPALDTKGFIITYNKFDEVFVSPQSDTIFIEEIKKINPRIEIL